jgi:hypothetical protein
VADLVLIQAEEEAQMPMDSHVRPRLGGGFRTPVKPKTEMAQDA